MRILIVNRILRNRTGTEVVTRDLALALRSKGHQVAVYSPVLGRPAEELCTAGIAVCNDLRRVPLRPDVVHGNHPKPLLDALRAYPGVPAVSVCHDATGVRDEPVFHPRILRYVAVDERCLRRIERNGRIAAHRVSVALNAVDLDRFAQRSPLPQRPARALVFSNAASLRTHLPIVCDACSAIGLPIDVLGERAGGSHPCPEQVLGRYDVVFAKARCALEAMAVGAAVVLCDAAGLGPMVTLAHFDRLRRMNFGQGLFDAPLTAGGIRHELARYDPADAAAVSARVRNEAGLDCAVSAWCGTYREVVAENEIRSVDPAEESAEWANVSARMRWEAHVERAERHACRIGSTPVAGPWLETCARHLLYRLAG